MCELQIAEGCVRGQAQDCRWVGACASDGRQGSSYQVPEVKLKQRQEREQPPEKSVEIQRPPEDPRLVGVGCLALRGGRCKVSRGTPQFAGRQEERNSGEARTFFASKTHSVEPSCATCAACSEDKDE
jgi:hypothetical protein